MTMRMVTMLVYLHPYPVNNSSSQYSRTITMTLDSTFANQRVDFKSQPVSLGSIMFGDRSFRTPFQEHVYNSEISFYRATTEGQSGLSLRDQLYMKREEK